jgi:DNA helicase-2/ATP-dependent DNA helicase PcrA
MRRMSKRFEIDNMTVIDREDQLVLMRLARGKHISPGQRYPKASDIVDRYSYARNTNKALEDCLDDFARTDPKLVEWALIVCSDYEAAKLESRYLDYDDILHQFAANLHSDNELRNYFSNRFDHILVDEMQDTNPLQWLILDALRDPALLFCVGDDAQSIYSFRGADYRNVHSFQERIPDGVVLKLERNYRSTQEILDIANWLLRESPLEYERELTADRGSFGARPKLIDFITERAQAAWTANDIAERREFGAALREHLVLTRTAYSARSLEAALLARKIPYIFHGGTKLLQAAHVRDALSLVRAAVNFQDSLAWARYLSLWQGIGDITASHLTDTVRTLSNWDTARQWLCMALVGQPQVIAGFDKVRQNLHSAGPAVRAAVEHLLPLLSEKYKYDNLDKRKKDLEFLGSLADEHLTIEDFLDTYTIDPLFEKETSPTATPDAVILSTIHSAKGRESPVVYIIQVNPGIYPHFRNLGKFDDEEEDRRVLYVALTRARNELFLLRSGMNDRQEREDDERFVIPGPGTGYSSKEGEHYFLSHLPDELVEHVVHTFTPTMPLGALVQNGNAQNDSLKVLSSPVQARLKARKPGVPEGNAAALAVVMKVVQTRGSIDLLAESKLGTFEETALASVARLFLGKSFTPGAPQALCDMFQVDWCEAKALSAGVSVGDVSEWRFNGWPTECLWCTKQLDRQSDNWRALLMESPQALSGWSGIIVHQVCPEVPRPQQKGKPNPSTGKSRKLTAKSVAKAKTNEKVPTKVRSKAKSKTEDGVKSGKDQ